MTISTYYYKIIDLFLEEYEIEFNGAAKGHCMKVTSLGISETLALWNKINDKFPTLNCYILSKDVGASGNSKFISDSKLIEYRNQQTDPLLILIPANNLSSTEDSFGNATFKNLSLNHLDSKLLRQLIQNIPESFKNQLDEIYNYLRISKIAEINYINYFLDLESQGFDNKNIGNFLYHLNLIPDTDLLSDPVAMRQRLNFNQKCISLLADFSKQTIIKVNELPVEPDTIQKPIFNFLKNESTARQKAQLCKLIFEKYPELNFAFWQIPEISKTNLQVFVENITGSDIKPEGDRKVLFLSPDGSAKIKMKVSTKPIPHDVPELAFFRVNLMSVDSFSPVAEIKRAKVTATNKPDRLINIVINANSIEEGAYFFRVFGEDEHGTILNINDRFFNDDEELLWQEMIQNDANCDKSSIQYRLTSDSEEFDITFEEKPPAPPSDRRKDKLSNVLQAFFKYRIEGLRNTPELTIPALVEDSGKWIENHERLKAIYHIKYSEKHNYQIIIPRKLADLEHIFLENSSELGSVTASLSTNPTQASFNSIAYNASVVNELVPEGLKNARIELFSKIRQSAPNNTGLLETFDFFNHIDLIKKYLIEFEVWISGLESKMSSLNEIDQVQITELHEFLTALQFIETIEVKTSLTQSGQVSILMLSPLHPLRLAWFLNLYDTFLDWEEKTYICEEYKKEWFRKLENIFLGHLVPDNAPLIINDPQTGVNYQYSGEIFFGWGFYTKPFSSIALNETLTSLNRQTKILFSNLFNIDQDNRLEADISINHIKRHIQNYLLSHPYTDKLIMNLFNAGDAVLFAEALVDLEKEEFYSPIKYELRLFKGSDRLITHGEALKDLLNPESITTEEAEAYSQSSENRLFPKLRFSINSISDFLKSPQDFNAHLSFLINPFPVKAELVKPAEIYTGFFFNSLIKQPSVRTSNDGQIIKWDRFVPARTLAVPLNSYCNLSIRLFNMMQKFVAGAMAGRPTDSIPATNLTLSEPDKVLLSSIHEFSDWVVTFDHNLGPEVFDLPTTEGEVPFLLDYLPGEETSGISSFLTTKPTSEIINLLSPHFNKYKIDYLKDEQKAQMLLEDLRAVSSSLILQLNSSENKAFEVIGTAFTKRVLEKKGILNDAFLIPIDLHKDLFSNLPTEDQSRADNLLVKIDPLTSQIEVTVIEIKCRSFISTTDHSYLIDKMKSQIQNTIEALRYHFDPKYNPNLDRLDRELQNLKFKSLLEFYINRAFRYHFLSQSTFDDYFSFIHSLDKGFSFKFKQLCLIYDFSSETKQKKEVVADDLTIFTFGKRLIKDILDPDSDLNTYRIEHEEDDRQIMEYFGKKELPEFIRSTFPVIVNPIDEKLPDESIHVNPVSIEPIIAPAKQDNLIPSEIDQIEPEISDYQESFNPNLKDSPVEFSTSSASNIKYDILIGKSSESPQLGILGKTINGKTVAIDLSETNTFSLFGVQGGGKSYTIGTVAEMVLKQFPKVNNLPSPLASVIFHYSESMDYAPEFTSMIFPNDKESEINKLKAEYGAMPGSIDDVILLTPRDKIEERRIDYPSIDIRPICFNSKELNVQDWMFLLGAIGNDSTYIRQLKTIMRAHRTNLSIDVLTQEVQSTNSPLSNSQKNLATQRLNFAAEYIDDSTLLKDVLKPGRLVIIDLRDEFIDRDEALGLFVVMLNIFSSVKDVDGSSFNKFIVFDEAHKYMGNSDLTDSIVTAIREMRHKGISIMIASQDPPSLPNEIIELSSIVLLHKFNSPAWLKHIQKSITSLNGLTPSELNALNPGEGFLWATKSTDKIITTRPIKIFTRPRVTKHGGDTVRAI